MPEFDLHWKFEGGFSKIVKGTVVELILKTVPGKISLETTPFDLPGFKAPIELIFDSSRSIKGQGPLDLKWTIKPESQIRALILPPGKAFLGNHRVAKNHYAIQWDIQAGVDSNSGIDTNRSIFKVAGNTRIKYSWVNELPETVSLHQALYQTWSDFIDPFSPEHINSLKADQVIYWKWTGGLNLQMAVEYELVQGWQFGKSSEWGSAFSVLDHKAFAEVRLNASKKGSFALRISKRKERFQFSLIKEKSSTIETGFQLGISSGHSLRLKGPHPLLNPLFKPVRLELRKSINRKLQLGLLADWKHWKKRKILLKAEWLQPDKSFETEYRELLESKLPTKRPGLKVTGRFEFIKQKTRKIHVNLFNWFQIIRSQEKADHLVVSINAAGDILLEQRLILEKSRITGHESELFKILSEYRYDSKEGNPFIWSFEKQGIFSQHDLKQILLSFLRVRTIEKFDLPAQTMFPADLNLIWITEFSGKAIEQVRNASSENRWKALIRAFELFGDRGDTRSGFQYDWIKSEQLRQLIIRDPIGAHLKSRYPVPGRNKAERQLVILQYRSVLRFQRMMDSWKAQERIDFRDILSSGLEIPVFAYFHLLSSRKYQRTVVAITGDFERAWGDFDLIN